MAIATAQFAAGGLGGTGQPLEGGDVRLLEAAEPDTDATIATPQTGGGNVVDEVVERAKQGADVATSAIVDPTTFLISTGAGAAGVDEINLDAPDPPRTGPLFGGGRLRDRVDVPTPDVELPTPEVDVDLPLPGPGEFFGGLSLLLLGIAVAFGLALLAGITLGRGGGGPR